MRRRFSLAWLILPVAVTTAVSVMAFRRVDVTNRTIMSVVATTSARLSVVRLDTSIGSYDNNALKLTFPSQPPGSTYTYNNVFQVLNRATVPITFRIVSVTGESAANGVRVRVTDSADATRVFWDNRAPVSSKLLDRYAAGGGCPCAVNLNVAITVDSGVPVGTPLNLTITVEGQY